MTLGREALTFGPDVPIGERIAQVADAQHGPVSSAQLRACGLTRSAISRRAQSGTLHRVHRGVYVPGRRQLGWLGHVGAALLACDARASTCHMTAARLRDLSAHPRTLVHVAVLSPAGHGHRGLVMHSARGLRPEDVNIVNGIPATSVARTLLDCAHAMGRRGTEKMVAEADHLGSFDLHAVRELLGHVRGHPGRAILRDAIGDAAGASGRTRSPVEDGLLGAFRAIRMDEPECNPPLVLPDTSVVYPDFLWRDGALVVEADPRGTHDTTASYRSDRERDRQLDAIGLQTMRFHDIELRDPAACARETLARLRLRRRQRHEFVPVSGTNS